VFQIDDSKARRNRKTPPSFPAFRLREIERTIPTRTVDQTRAVLAEVAVTYRKIILFRGLDVRPGMVKERLELWLGKMRLSRTFTPDEIAEAIEQAERRKRLANPERLAAILGLEYADRQQLAIRTIGSIDKTKLERELLAKERRREKDRIRKAIKRRARGAISRAEYLAESMSHARPWERDGISRRTWERRRNQVATERDAGPSTHHLRVSSADTLASKGNVRPAAPAMRDALLAVTEQIGAMSSTTKRVSLPRGKAA
jgi:hypothetical protein